MSARVRFFSVKSLGISSSARLCEATSRRVPTILRTILYKNPSPSNSRRIPPGSSSISSRLSVFIGLLAAEPLCASFANEVKSWVPRKRRAACLRSS